MIQASVQRLISTICIGLAMVEMAVSTTASQQASPLQPGRYTVSVETRMPNIGPPLQEFENQMLIGCNAGSASTTTGLGPIAESPLTSCPHVNARSEKDRMTFEIICPGPNTAQAVATYVKTPRGFSAQIKMNMGGKNMTIEERQSGRLVGPCPRKGNLR